jgi:hypothetical protein
MMDFVVQRPIEIRLEPCDWCDGTGKELELVQIPDTWSEPGYDEWVPVGPCAHCEDGLVEVRVVPVNEEEIMESAL